MVMYYDEGDVVYGDILYMRHKGKKTERPTIIILEEKKETVIIAPFSHKFKAGTYHLPVISPKEIVGKNLMRICKSDISRQIVYIKSYNNISLR
ncbi:hypothetical protein LCGC14_1162350 [marine sediment metagenome]|uniref:PemK-like protein n=1 Tax=marine sediment metagenome TaxID=412755 RepID=A0A0F9LS53_9ZZZZ